jgi:hypothetical protein
MSKRNSRQAKARRRAARGERIFSATGSASEGFARFGLDLPSAVVAELDGMGDRGELPEGFTVGFGDASDGLPPGAVAQARDVFPGGWEPGWYWRCGRPGCRGGETIGSPELTAAIGACTGC